METKPRAALTPTLQDIVDDLIALKHMEASGTLTFHAQRKLVKDLDAKDLASVARAVMEHEKRQKPIFDRSNIQK
jgi:hypothetical protein